MPGSQDMPKTTKHEWVIERHILVRIGIGLIIYTTIAEAVGFELEDILEGMDQERSLTNRLGELAFLWTMCCSAVGWIAIWRKKPPSRDALIWPIVAVIVAGMSVPIAAGAFETYTRLAQPFLGIASPLDALPWVFIPLFFTTVLCFAIWGQAHVWKQDFVTGICSQCGYDLTGNTLGRCPECGIQIDDQGRTMPRGMLKTAPEIRLFQTAANRDEALRNIQGELRRHSISWIGNVAWIASMTLLVIGEWVELNWVAWAVVGIGLAITLIMKWWYVRERRKRLRCKLNESGIRVCMKCGEDLRKVEADQCPNCEATI